MKYVLVSLLALTNLHGALLGAKTPSERAVELRNRGIAELENETPVRAEETFRQLVSLTPYDPLGFANLAIAALRQQKFEEAWEWIDKARELAPEDPHLEAISAEIHHWSGDSKEALAAFRSAAAAAPDNVDFQYSLLREAAASNEPGADEVAAVALDRLASLRPENLVVMLQLGQRARENGDRAAMTAVYLRIRELIWQAPHGADRLLGQILDGLEEGETESLRSSALRLENVLKITPMYKEGLRELSSGIQGIPLERFRNEPDTTSWGPTNRISFVPRQLAREGNVGAALAFGDLDGDENAEISRIVGSEQPRLEIRSLPTTGDSTLTSSAPADFESLTVVDLDNDGTQELLAYGTSGTAVWKMAAAEELVEVTGDFGLGSTAGRAAVAIDFDIEGDLDLAVGGESLALLRNSLEGPLEDVTEQSLPVLDLPSINDLVATDLDRDGDVDLVVAHDGGLVWLDNLRQGLFADRSSALPPVSPVSRIVSADLDNDGRPDLVTAGSSLTAYRNLGDRFSRMDLGIPAGQRLLDALEVFDADNDGRLDIASAGPDGLILLAQTEEGFSALPVPGSPSGITAIQVADIDLDGDMDLLTDGSEGLVLLENDGGNRNRHLTVRLRGLNTGNSKNNSFGVGSVVEVRSGSAYQFREARGESVHFGLGSVTTPDLMRVVWPNGVPQNRLAPETNQRIVEEQLLKGSCPFLYVESADGFEFVTDLLWGAPIGLPAGDGGYLGADPTELVFIGTVDELKNRYELRITEELWEAAFFDAVRLWIVDHPLDTEAASSLRIQPGESVPEMVHLSRSVRQLASALDASGRDATGKVQKRDEVYADGWRPSRYQGVSDELWAFTLDLGEAPGRSIRLLLDGWIFPTDASLNLALAQRSGPHPVPPRLDVEIDGVWKTLMSSTGFPAGKTKTMIIDTPPLPRGASRLRIVSSQWLSWDRIAWTDEPADGDAVIRGKLTPSGADLRYRGFSALVRKAPNAPHSFEYARTTEDSPWLPFPGRYTRYGDVRELLLETDDRSVILGPGDEMAIVFDTSGIPPVESGFARSVFLESHGWDKDADRNTGAGLQVGPLPFRAMSRYPYPPTESFPESPAHRTYVEEWLTRVVESPTPPALSAP
jgi:tetratricopeptide (TPR) repeat protein